VPSWITIVLFVFAVSASKGYTEGFSRSGRWDLSLQGGAAIPVGDNIIGSNPSTSPLIQGSLFYNANSWMSLGMEIGYSTDHAQHFTGQAIGLHNGIYSWTGSYKGNYKLKVLQVTPEIEIGSWFGSFKPYLTFGGGFYRTEETVESDIWWVLPNQSNTSSYGGINGGGGLLYKLGENFATGPDIRYQRIFMTGQSFSYLATELRLSYLF